MFEENNQICHLDFLPYELFNIISDFLNRKGNRRFRQAYRRYEKVFFEHYTLNTMTILKKDIKSKDLELFSNYRSLDIESEIREKDISILSECRKLILHNSGIIGMYLEDLPLKHLETNQVLDYEFIEDMYFDYLKVKIESVEDLQYLHCDELEIARGSGNLTDRNSITQEIIDSIGCNSLILNIPFMMENVKIDKLTANQSSFKNVSAKSLSSKNIGSINISGPNGEFESNNSPITDGIDIEYLEELTLSFTFKDEIDINLFHNIKRLHLNNASVDFDMLHVLNCEEISLIKCRGLTDEHTIMFSTCKYINFSDTNIIGIHFGDFECTELIMNNCHLFNTEYIEDKVFDKLELNDSRNDRVFIKNIPHAKHISLQGRMEINDEMLRQLSESFYINILDCNIQGNGLKYLVCCKRLRVNYDNFISEYLEDLCCDYLYLGNSFYDTFIGERVVPDVEISTAKTSQDRENSNNNFEFAKDIGRLFMGEEQSTHFNSVVDGLRNINNGGTDDNENNTRSFLSGMANMALGTSAINDDGNFEETVINSFMPLYLSFSNQ